MNQIVATKIRPFSLLAALVKPVSNGFPAKKHLLPRKTNQSYEFHSDKSNCQKRFISTDLKHFARSNKSSLAKKKEMLEKTMILAMLYGATLAVLFAYFNMELVFSFYPQGRSRRFDSIREMIDSNRSSRGVSDQVSNDIDDEFIGHQENDEGDDIPNVPMTTKDKENCDLDEIVEEIVEEITLG